MEICLVTKIVYSTIILRTFTQIVKCAIETASIHMYNANL